MAKTHSLRTWFARILLGVMAALVLAAFMLLHWTWELQRDRLQHELQRTAWTLAASIDRSLQDQTRQLLALVQHLPPDGAAAIAELRERAMASKQTDASAGWDTFSLNDASGVQHWNTAFPGGTAGQPAVVREHDRQVVATGRPYVSDVFEGRVTGRKLVAVAVPVAIGAQTLVLAGTLDPPQLRRWFDGAQMEGVSVGGVLDRQLRFVTRTSLTDVLIGAPASPEWTQAVQQSPEAGVTRLRTLEGVVSYTAWARLASIGWTVGIAVPAQPVESALYQSLMTFAAWSLVVLLGGGLVIHRLGQRLVRDVEALRTGALTLGQGAKAPQSFNIGDLEVIWRAMQDADERLARATERLKDEARAREEALVDSQRRLGELNAVLAAVPAPIFIARDAHCSVIDANPAAYQLLGMPMGSNLSHSDGELAGRLQLLLDGQPAQVDRLPMRRAAAGETVRGAGFSARLEDGTLRHLLGNATPVLDSATGAPVGAVGAFLDLTDLLELQEQLALSRRELQNIADHSPDVIVRFDRELRHVYVNATIERITGMPPSQIIGRTNRELGMEPALCERWDAMLLAVFETGEPQRMEFSFQNVEGRQREFLGRFVPEFDAEGRVVHALGVVHDQTAEVLHARLLAQDHQRLSRFIANFAHELRTPLSTMSVGLQVLRLSSPGSDRAASSVELVERQLVHMVRLIDDLMEASRADAGKLRLILGIVVMQDVISDAMMGLSSAVHRVSVHAPPDPVRVKGDATRLQQVLANLLNNAIKYSPNGGDIMVTLTHDPKHVRLSVRDHGLGIPTDKLAEVFEPFSQIDAHQPHAQGGMGLGLAIVRQIVLLHGGTVAAFSDGKTGTEMVVELPPLAGNGTIKSAS